VWPIGGRQSQETHYLVDNQEKPTSVKDYFKYWEGGKGILPFVSMLKKKHTILDQQSRQCVLPNVSQYVLQNGALTHKVSTV
jgi:hypothetical protein